MHCMFMHVHSHGLRGVHCRCTSLRLTTMVPTYITALHSDGQ